MQVVIKQAYNWMDRARENMTYQEAFPESARCIRCKKGAKLMMVIDDDEGMIAHCKPRDHEGIWPHDCMAMALYICRKCGEITIKWNQA